MEQKAEKKTGKTTKLGSAGTGKETEVCGCPRLVLLLHLANEARPVREHATEGIRGGSVGFVR
jgi:hypothetical protein